MMSRVVLLDLLIDAVDDNPSHRPDAGYPVTRVEAEERILELANLEGLEHDGVFDAWVFMRRDAFVKQFGHLYV